MHLAMLDLAANTGKSCWHRASPMSKLAFTLAVVGAAVICNKPLPLGADLGLVALAMGLSRVPLRQLGHMLLIPVSFSALFALSVVGPRTLQALIVLKATASASALLLLMCTTPAPAVFGLIRKLLPGALADALFITYRAFFVLLDELWGLAKATRLRGRVEFTSLAAVLGTLLLRCLDKTQRMEQALQLRGYKCGAVYTSIEATPSLCDLAPWTFTLVVMLGAWFSWKKL
ncbi:MAG: energy-coupling factor transporter transmembrane component T family protein [Bacillota bacterium]